MAKSSLDRRLFVRYYRIRRLPIYAAGQAFDDQEAPMLTRRHLLAPAATVVAVGALPAPAAHAALPEVDMEAVIKAAQIDPRRPDTALTPGAKDSVLAVER